ncbi:MAG: hypothetical protein KDC66_21420 [Phaeodactylibacter sp.]|nr:hypothetical protein [Phaeodactylibacter sp.]MCB9272561.1 hypothetical protein [Lewinellaceae bacterium]
MKNTLAYELIRSFSRQGLRQARQWLASPYHNQRADMQLLFDHLAEAAERGVPPERRSTWAVLFPGAPYDDQQLRLMVSYLFKLLERFLALRELEASPFLGGQLLLQAYRRRQLPRHFAHAFHYEQKQLERQPLRHPEYHQAHYALELEHYQMESAQGRTRELNLQELEEQLTFAFLAMKLRQGCFALAHQAVFNTHYSLALEEEILALAARQPYTDKPAVAVYYHGYQAMRHPEQEELFPPFREKLMEALEVFPQEELRDLFLLGINLCISKINRNRSAFLREALELYRRGIEAGILIEDGRLSRFTYNNVIGIALRLQELSWAERFLHQYRPLLEPEQQEATFSLNAARLAFAGKDYGLALTHLQRADYKDLINNLVAKTLQLKAYYELSEFDLLDSHLKTMQAFLRRNRRLGYHQQNYGNIVRFTRRLLALRPGDEAASKALQQAIESAGPLTEKGWLLEKVKG